MNLNVGHLPQVALQRLANQIRSAKISAEELGEVTSVDPASGAVTRIFRLCRSCAGTCCTSLRVPITREDARRLARHLGGAAKLPLFPPAGTEDEPEDLAGYLTLGDTPCPFFAGRCTVHEARPDVCRSFGLHACLAAGTFVPASRLGRRAQA